MQLREPRLGPRSAPERLLGAFAEVHAGEGATVLLLALNVFLLLTAYYIIKPVREALILSGGGAELKSYLSAGQVALLAGAVPAYAALAGRLSRRRLINAVTLFFAGCLAVFYLLAVANVPLGVVFFLWVGIFNLMVIAQFWAFANDLYTPEEGKRLFAIVAFGASLGAVLGSTVTKALIKPLGVYQLMLVAAAVLLVSLLLTNVVDRRERRRVASRASTAAGQTDAPIGKGGAFQLVVQTRYLLLIALMMLVLNWVNTTGEYLLGRKVSEAAKAAALAAGHSPDAAAHDLFATQFIGDFYSGFQLIVNVAGVLLQLFVVSRVLKYLGVRVAILVLPAIALAGYLSLAFVPVLAVVRWAKTAENATDYSLQNTVRQVLFLPTTREQKYKAKQAIDSFFWRAGDVMSALLVLVGSRLHLGVTAFALVNAGLVLAWIGLAAAIGAEHRRLVASTGPAKADAARAAA